MALPRKVASRGYHRSRPGDLRAAGSGADAGHCRAHCPGGRARRPSRRIQRRLPAPFGPAANGLIVYAAPTDPSWVDKSDYQRPQGDIYMIDPVTGTSSVLVGGPTVDGSPVVSLDGTRVAFVRDTPAGQQLFAVDVTGGNPLPLIGGSLPEIIDVAWSPDGTSIAFIASRGSLEPVDRPIRRHRCAPGRPRFGSLVCPAAVATARTATSCCSSAQRARRSAFCPTSATATSSAPSKIRRGRRSACTSSAPDGSDSPADHACLGPRYDYGLVCWTPDGRRDPHANRRFRRDYLGSTCWRRTAGRSGPSYRRLATRPSAQSSHRMGNASHMPT